VTSITVIIPTYRRPQLLRRAIESVLEQDYADLQVCVYDNHSCDATAQVVSDLARADPRVRYTCHDRNIGGLANFQFGMARVDTPYFSFLSDDDYLLPGFFATAIPALAAAPEAIFWAGLTLRMDADGGFFDATLDKWDREGLFAPPDGVLRLLRGNAPCWAGTVFRRQAIEEIGLLDEAVGGAADLDYMVRAAARHPYIVSKLPAAVFTMHPGSVSETAPFSLFWPGWLKIARNVEEVASMTAPARAQIVEVVHQDARRMLFRRGANALAKADIGFARHCARALREHYGLFAKSLLLRAIATACASLPLAQQAYTACYRAAERQILRRREGLRANYAGIVRRR
jgi:glycosyltransferase involved in cell wall biosynthesis